MKPNKIYVFERPDGTIWADYTNNGTKITSYTIDTKEKAEQVFNREDVSARVKALALRKINEIETPIEIFPTKSIQDRSIWGKLMWVFTGK